MDHMTHKEKGHTSDPRSDHKMSDLQGSHGSLHLHLHLRVSAVGDQTALSGIMRLVAAARASASRAQALADCAAALRFYVTVVSGGITFAYWFQEHRSFRFRAEGNERPHEALDMKCPAEVYQPSPRPYPGLPDIDYPLHDKTIVVARCGRICLA
jgi:hypothetical protein